jgi:hypothetical protein
MNSPVVPLEVEVDYQLAEYKRVLRDYIPVHMAAEGETVNRRLPWNWPILEAPLFAVFVTVAFLIKKAKLGNSVFTFTAEGFSRSTKLGTGKRAWNEVRNVHQLSGAYLIELKAGGGLPVPYRVFTPEQRDVFESLIGHVGKDVA